MPTNSTYTTFHGDLPTCRDTQDLVRRLKKLGMPHAWARLAYAFVPPLNIWCLQHAEDGDVSHLDAEQIADICGWPVRSKAAGFRAALLAAGFLERTKDGRVLVHNFTTYNARLLNERKRQRARRKTAKPYKDTTEDTHAGSHAAESADAYAYRPPINGDEDGNGDGDKTESKEQITENGGEAAAVCALPEQPETAGASRPISEAPVTFKGVPVRR